MCRPRKLTLLSIAVARAEKLMARSKGKSGDAPAPAAAAAAPAAQVMHLCRAMLPCLVLGPHDFSIKLLVAQVIATVLHMTQANVKKVLYE